MSSAVRALNNAVRLGHITAAEALAKATPGRQLKELRSALGQFEPRPAARVYTDAVGALGESPFTCPLCYGSGCATCRVRR